MIALVDGDILVYRFGFGSEGGSKLTLSKALDEFFLDLRDTLSLKDMEGFISGPSEKNFRHKIAVTAPYKGQRPSKKPEHYDYIREYLTVAWDFVETDEIEADDAIATRATELGDDAIICSIDKDFDQVPGWHYNFVKGTKYYVTEEESIRNFYIQVLTGDRIDNIIGLKGIGPTKANRLLAKCSTEREMYCACVDAYGGDNERVHENARLLYLRKSTNRYWNPPE